MTKAVALARGADEDERDILDGWMAKPARSSEKKRGDWIARMVREAGVMRVSTDWSRCRAGHLVALYAWCHEYVYDVPAGELDGVAFVGAAQRAKKFVEEQLGKDFERAVDFIRWTWGREGAREKRARAEGYESRRLGWRLQFSASLATDYRLSLARKGESIT